MCGFAVLNCAHLSTVMGRFGPNVVICAFAFFEGGKICKERSHALNGNTVLKGYRVRCVVKNLRNIRILRVQVGP